MDTRKPPADAQLEARVDTLEQQMEDVGLYLQELDGRVTALETPPPYLDHTLPEPPPRPDHALPVPPLYPDHTLPIRPVRPDNTLPPIVEPPTEAVAGLSATLAFDNGTTITFALADGVDLGDYTAPSGTFVQGCVRTRNPALPNVLVDFRVDKSSDRIEIVVWVGECMGDVPSQYFSDLLPYTLTLTDDAGAVVHTADIPVHLWGTRWRWCSAPRPLLRTAAQVFDEEFLPRMTAQAARIDGYDGVIVPSPPLPVGTYQIFMPVDDMPAYTKLGIQAAIDTGGERAEIGLVTEWQADWLLRGTETSLHAMFQQAEMFAGDIDFYVPDQVTSHTINYKESDKHYSAHTLGREYDTSNTYEIKHREPCNGWYLHEAESHLPNIFYLPWVLTEDPYYIEGQQYMVGWAIGWDIYERQAVYGHLGDRVLCSYTHEIRTMGWGVRNLAVAYRMSPGDGPGWLMPQAWYQAVSADYQLVIDELFTKNPALLYRLFRQFGSDNYWQAFQQAYAIMGMALADLVGLPGWREPLEYYFGMFEGILNGASGWDQQVPQPHDIYSSYMAECATWADAMAHANVGQLMKQNASFPEAAFPGNRQGGSMGNVSQMYAACACAEQRGVAAATACREYLDEFIDHNYPHQSDASMGISFYAKCGFNH